MSHPEYTQDELDALALYSLSLLEGDERSNLEEHLSGGCTDCESHLMGFRRAAAFFGEYAVPPVGPPITLRTRVLAITGISAQSFSPDSNSKPVQSSHSQTASLHTSHYGGSLENGGEPWPLRQNQEHVTSDSDSRLVSPPRSPVEPPVKRTGRRLEHKPTRKKHLSAPRDRHTSGPEQKA
jgi:hypothetical protein